MGVLKKMDKLIELERKELWDDIRVYLYDLWNLNRADKDITLRLATECWYIIVEGTVINAENIDHNKFTKILHEVTDYSLKNLSDDSDVLWVFGYMISLFPYCFYEHEEWGREECKVMKKKVKK